MCFRSKENTLEKTNKKRKSAGAKQGGEFENDRDRPIFHVVPFFRRFASFVIRSQRTKKIQILENLWDTVSNSE